MNHDDFVEFLAKNWLSKRSETIDVEIETEAHYNHYGTRGVADLVVSTCRHTITGMEASQHIVEAKTHLDDAHRVLRQFKKMSRFFYKDEDRIRPKKTAFELTVLPTEENLRHLLKYRSLYLSVTEFRRQENFRQFVSFRGPRTQTPIILFPSDDEWRFPSENWWTYAKKNPELASLKDQLEENSDGL